MNKSIIALILFCILFWLWQQNIDKKPNPISKIPELPSIELPPPVIPDPVFINVIIQRENIKEDSLYADIMNRSIRIATEYDRNTNAHETTHFINSELRNSYNRESSKRVNAFYVTAGRGVVIEEPEIRKSAVIPFLPEELRGDRYKLYVAGQREWDDTPLYLVDEWVSYVNGGAVSVEDVQQGRHDGQWSDAVYGCLEFSIYCIALAMAVEQEDPEYYKENDQFYRFMYWHLLRSQEIYRQGSQMEEFRWERQEKLLNKLRTSESAKEMREFIHKNFSGVWLN